MQEDVFVNSSITWAVLLSFEYKVVLVQFSADLVYKNLVSTLIGSTLSFKSKCLFPLVNEISQGKFTVLVQKSISYLDSTIWNMTTVIMKNLPTTSAFKTKVKKCQKAAHVGYVNLAINCVGLFLNHPPNWYKCALLFYTYLIYLKLFCTHTICLSASIC